MGNFDRFNIKDVANSPIAKLNQHLFQGKAPPKKAKYNNQKTLVDGERFDSKKEAKRRGQLKIRLRLGEILFLARQVEFMFHIDGQKISSYYADFVYIETKNGALVVEDVKSIATRKLSTYRLKKKMMLIEHKIKIREV